jgi:hypothetical protein
MNISRKCKLIVSFIIIAFIAGCAGTPIRFGGNHPNFDKANVDFSKGREIVASASGFQLLLVIPIGINSRHEEAYKMLRLNAGNDYITDVKIEESWSYAFIGTVYTTTIRAVVYPHKTI